MNNFLNRFALDSSFFSCILHKPRRESRESDENNTQRKRVSKWLQLSWRTLYKGSESTWRGESDNDGLPYDDHVMFGRESPMHFEEIKRRPSRMGKKDWRNKQRDRRDIRENQRKIEWTEKEENMIHEQKKMIICYRWPTRTWDNGQYREEG